MKQRLTMLLVSLFLLVGGAFSQTKVSGTVVSQEDGQPVIGASILVVGTNTGVVTNADGKFSLTMPAGKKTLRITYVGMEPLEVSARPNMKIVLTNDQKALDEVIVVAFGTQKKSSFTGSAAIVGADELSQKITTNVADALVGSVPGLQIRGSSGQPGASQGSIHIRGIASMYADTEPLIVVDGAPYSSSLSNLPQDDIESVTVLKDAASAALYGARGAAGVILITTKKGKTQDAQINVDMKWGANTRSIQDYETITDPAQFMEVYYKQFYNYATANGLSNAAANKWVNDRIITNQNWGLQYNPFTLPDGQNLIGLDGKLNPNATLGRAYTYNGETYYMYPDNWQDEAYHTGFRQEYTANVSGGTSNSSFYASAGYLNEDGIIDNSNYERFTGRLKADYQARPWLRVGANVGFVHSNQEENPNFSVSELGSNNMAYYTSMIAPIYPLYVRSVDALGNPYIRTDQYGHLQYDYGVPATNFPGNGTRLFLATGNPIGANQYNTSETTVNQFNGSFTLDIDITSWLKFNSNNNLNHGQSIQSVYGNPFYGPSASENGNIDKKSSSTLRQNYVQTLNFHKEFGKHNAQLMLGHEWYKTTTKVLEALANKGFSPDVPEINAFSNRYNSYSYTTAYNVEGWFANAQYDYDQKYFGSVSYRRDASSRFHPDHRWGNFWSVGGAWMISSESFMESTKSWLDQLKLKVSIGQQGNDGIGNWAYIDLYSLSKGENGMLPSFDQIGNEDITWETTTNFNVGLEWSILHGRLTGSFDVYNKKVADQLFWLSIPESFGARGYWGNLGDIRNTGFELVVSGDVIRTKDITWNVTANLSHNTTKILKLPESKTKINGGFRESDSDSNMSLWYEEGQGLYNAMLPEYAGVYSMENYYLTGDATYDPKKAGMALYWQDTNLLEPDADDPTDPSKATMTTTKPGKEHNAATTDWNKASYYAQGSILPKVTGGFSTSLKIYDFDVNATFDYQLGGKLYDNRYMNLMTPVATSGNGQTYHKDVLDSWTVESPNTNIPRWQYNDLYTSARSTRFLTSASYLNFQSFTVGYTLPRSLTDIVKLSKVRVYCQGENIYFWSKRKGLDPRYSFAGTNSGGVNAYSPARTIMGGIQVSF
ncbi:MAG: TonB-dependent receptor [Prevotella sp.]|nr:TonB-dependent receptor [Prevotella sp.]